MLVRDVLQLDYLKELIPLTGAYGFERDIITVGILDHEIIEDNYEVFRKGEFVVTTLSVARDEEQLVFKAIKALINRQAAGVAIKSVYYDTLSNEIVTYAKAHNFPIFIFHDVYIELILNNINQALETRLMHNIYETKIESLLTNQLNHYMINQLIDELNSNFNSYHCVYFLKEKKYFNTDKCMDLAEIFQKQARLESHCVFKFRTGLLVITTFTSAEKSNSISFNQILQLIELDAEYYYIGQSSLHHKIEHLHKSISEAIHASQTSEIKNENLTTYEDMGIYKLVIPLLDNTYAIEYASTLLQPIIEYDVKYESKLYETLRIYFECGCQTLETSLKIFQHKNTVLYRINKVKEIIGPFKNNLDFNTQLSLAISIKESIYQSPLHKDQ